jgi:hypothetical protein
MQKKSEAEYQKVKKMQSIIFGMREGLGSMFP